MFLAALTLLALAPPGQAAPTSPSFQGVPIESLARYDGQSTCSPTAKPGAVALRSLVLASYPGTGDYGIVRDCATGGVSEHKEGRAWDWKVDALNPTQDAAARDLLAWLLRTDGVGHSNALARRLGIMYMIYNRQVWSAWNAGAGWQPYTGANPHTDHVHISLSWPGAQQQTSYWTAQPPPATITTSTQAITARWLAVGGAGGPLGEPLGAESAVRGGQAQRFQGGQILWSTGTGAHAVWGAIGQHYTSLGGPGGPLGLPLNSESDVPGGRGNTFTGGQVLWSPGTGAHAVWGAIGQRYTSLGGPGGPLGLPTSSESDVPGGRGNTFTGGQVLWSPGTGAHAVWGAIGQRYTALAGPDGPLGLPTSSESDVPGGRGNTFTGGQVLWSPGTGAHAVWGAIGQRYTSLGGPGGPLGLPLNSESDIRGGRGNTFTGGQVLWSPGTGAHAVWGAIGQRYTSLGGPGGPLGLPTSDEYDVPGGRRSDFTGGRLTWTESTGTVTGP